MQSPRSQVLAQEDTGPKTMCKDLESGSVLLPLWLPKLILMVCRQSSHVCLSSSQFWGALPAQRHLAWAFLQVSEVRCSTGWSSSSPGSKQCRGEKLKLSHSSRNKILILSTNVLIHFKKIPASILYFSYKMLSALKCVIKLFFLSPALQMAMECQ